MQRTVEAIEQAIATHKKLSQDEGYKLARKIWAEGYTVDLIMKIENDIYSDWYRESRKKYPEYYRHETLEDETTYTTTNDNKAFKSGMCGYSIFACSLATYKRKERGQQITPDEFCERIEHYPCDWIIVLEETKRK